MAGGARGRAARRGVRGAAAGRRPERRHVRDDRRDGGTARAGRVRLGPLSMSYGMKVTCFQRDLVPLFPLTVWEREGGAKRRKGEGATGRL